MRNVSWETIAAVAAVSAALVGVQTTINRWFFKYGKLTQRADGLEARAEADRQAFRQELRETRVELSTRIDDIMKILISMQQSLKTKTPKTETR